jgi:hypothetical protein
MCAVLSLSLLLPIRDFCAADFVFASRLRRQSFWSEGVGVGKCLIEFVVFLCQQDFVSTFLFGNFFGQLILI